jgi:4-hydroxyproline epimerase
MSSLRRVQIIDSHTGGEPTRIVIGGGPELPPVSMRERLNLLRDRHDWLRSAVVNEPRGSDTIVGALLCQPVDPTCAAGIIFFNNVGYLHMCGHGTIGLMVTLAHMGKIKAGLHKLETPVGMVSARLHEFGSVTLRNVASHRYRQAVRVDVPGHGPVHGDIAWGGNWFFLVQDHGQTLTLANVKHLTDFTTSLSETLIQSGITGADGGKIDHIELFGPPSDDRADSRNFVLCPGMAYDRSPCGTGTSAKLACLVADGKLRPGEVWRQESIVGSVFEGSVELVDGKIFPSITGTAFITSEASLVLDERDPFCMGIRG